MRATLALSIAVLVLLGLAASGWTAAAHWKAQADKYAYALSDN